MKPVIRCALGRPTMIHRNFKRLIWLAFKRAMESGVESKFTMFANTMKDQTLAMLLTSAIGFIPSTELFTLPSATPRNRSATILQSDAERPLEIV